MWGCLVSDVSESEQGAEETQSPVAPTQPDDAVMAPEPRTEADAPFDLSPLQPPPKCEWCNGTGNAGGGVEGALGYWPCGQCGGTGKGRRKR